MTTDNLIKKRDSSTISVTSIKGMNDVLPNDSYSWLWLESILREWLDDYGYKNIRTPIIEQLGLYTRSVGENTDIVEKEMYSFVDKLNGDSLALRPEGTAGVVRAVLEHNLLYNSIQKLWYLGQMFRHERPQKGRYRQFNQLGVELFGVKDPIADAEIVAMQYELWKRLNVENIELQINCLGQKEERLIYREALIKYFEQYTALMSDSELERLHKNPLRLLDSKNPKLQAVIVSAPKLIDYLGESSVNFYRTWKLYLQELGIPFVENSSLVRGLDYYNLSVFEWVSTALGAQSTVSAGGRYDPLIAELGGDDNYAIGFAIGIERLLILLQEQQKIPAKPRIDSFIAVMRDDYMLHAQKIAQLLRNAKFKVEQSFTASSLKSQIRKASSLGALSCIIIGDDEINNHTITLKIMDSQQQLTVQCNELIDCLNGKLGIRR